MRSSRRFRPSIDCLQLRIAPSSMVASTTDTTSTPSAAQTADITGSPGSDPNGEGSYEIIMTPPGSTSTIGDLC